MLSLLHTHTHALTHTSTDVYTHFLRWYYCTHNLLPLRAIFSYFLAPLIFFTLNFYYKYLLISYHFSEWYGIFYAIINWLYSRYLSIQHWNKTCYFWNKFPKPAVPTKTNFLFWKLFLDFEFDYATRFTWSHRGIWTFIILCEIRAL